MNSLARKRMVNLDFWEAVCPWCPTKGLSVIFELGECDIHGILMVIRKISPSRFSQLSFELS